MIKRTGFYALLLLTATTTVFAHHESYEEQQQREWVDAAAEAFTLTTLGGALGTVLLASDSKISLREALSWFSGSAAVTALIVGYVVLMKSIDNKNYEKLAYILLSLTAPCTLASGATSTGNFKELLSGVGFMATIATAALWL